VLGGSGWWGPGILRWLLGLDRLGVSDPSSLSLGGNAGTSDWMCIVSSFCRVRFYIANRWLDGPTPLKGAAATTMLSPRVCGLDGGSPLTII